MQTSQWVQWIVLIRVWAWEWEDLSLTLSQELAVARASPLLAVLHHHVPPRALVLSVSLMAFLNECGFGESRRAAAGS